MSCAKCEDLERENKELKGQNKELRRENEELKRENAELKRDKGDLKSHIHELEKKCAEHERAQKRQAAPFSKGPPNPKPPGRKPGEAYGQHAHRPAPEQIDEVHEAPLPERCECGGTIEEVEVQSQYQTEVPRKPIRREFRVHIGRCKDCGRRHQGRHPFQTSDALGAAASQMGPQAKALAVQMNKELGVPYGKIQRFFRKAFEITVCRAAPARIVLAVARRAEPIYRRILVIVRRSRLVYPDETGWRVEGLLWWMLVFVARTATAYVIRNSRGYDVPSEVLGPKYSGTLGHDGWAPYDKFEEAEHQQCLGHLLRRSKKILEVAKRGAVRFPRAVKEILQQGLELRDRRDAGEVSPHGLAVAIGRLEARMERLLDGEFTYELNRTFAKHLREHQDQLFTFLRNPAVEATSWPADHAIRPCTVNRKVWGGNRTPVGAEAQGILCSVLRTWEQRGYDVVEFLTRLIRLPEGAPLPRELALAPGS